jgi:signal transduction histidine kinase
MAVLSFVLFQIPIVFWAFQHGASFEAWRRYLVFSIISALVPNLLLVLIILRIISRPVQKITLAAIDVAKGGYGTEVDMRHTNDEIGILADSFNEMSRKMASDIGEMQRLNEQLILTEKLAAMGTLAAGVAHEVNNPLASISSLIQMISADDKVNIETKEKLKLISTQIQRISQVTKDMTDFARARPSTKRAINLNAVISASLRLASFDKRFQELEIAESLAPQLPTLLADSDQMQQVLLNFFLNSRDAMPGGGKLYVGSEFDSDEVRVVIRDTGCGIDEVSRKKVFDPFFTTKPAGNGTGLGLAVCYGIVSAHGGSIEINEAIDSGTEFIIRLPRV